jgi:hypothetical protein
MKLQYSYKKNPFGFSPKSLEIKTIDGLGFLYIILINTRNFLPSFSQNVVDKSFLLDFKYFSIGELVFI